MLILSVTIAFLLLGMLWFAAVLHEHGLKPMRRMAELMKRPAAEIALVALFAIGMIHHGATKGTNGVNGAGGEMGGGANVANVEMLPMANANIQLVPGTELENGDIGTGNNYTMATLITNTDWLAFGGYEDWFPVDEGAWCFRFGSNLVERLTVFSCGEIASAPFGASNRISLLGLPLSIAPAANWHLLSPQQSLFWHSVTPSNTLLLTWVNALVNRDTNLPVTVQAELFPDGTAALRYGFDGIGDINSLSNAEARIVRDGVPEAVPLMTGAVTLVEFAAPAIAGTNALDEVYARIAGGNTNAYYCADVVVSKGPSKIRVEPMADETNRGLLGAYEIVALPGETNRLPLLIGPKYTVSAEVAFELFELVPPPFVPLADDTGTVERLEFGEAFSATNVTDRLVEIQWPAEFALEEIDATPEATTYALRVTPDWLGGVLTWHGIADTNAPPMRGSPPMRSGGDSCSCGCLVRDGLDLIHYLSCECEHCYVNGELVYEGHTEEFGCDMKDDHDEGENDPAEEAHNEYRMRAEVFAKFDKAFVMFEAPYMNEPTGIVVNPLPSSTTKLTVSAYGGWDGVVVNLEAIFGGIEACPEEDTDLGIVAPGEFQQWEIMCKGVQASPNKKGGVARVGYYDIGLGELKNRFARTTSVEIKLQPNDLVNGCSNRHVVGVCERVRCLHEPDEAPVEWSIISGSGFLVDYGTAYLSPVTGTSAILKAKCGGVEREVCVNVIEPSSLWCSNYVLAVTNEPPTNKFGGIGMKLPLYVLPLTVSFKGIVVEEVPCNSGDPHDFFSNPDFSEFGSHTRARGAGEWLDVEEGNAIGIDTTTFGDWPLPWSIGEMTWDIPIGWKRKGSSSISQEGDFPVVYKSEWKIYADGTISKTKHGHTISKTTNGVVRLDGVIINGN